MLELSDITLRLRADDRTLTEGFSFTLSRGDRAVLIGEEGNGKSTLLRYIVDPGSVEAYCECSGRVSASGPVGYLPQSMPDALRELTAAEYFGSAAYYDHLGVLGELGIDTDFLSSDRKLGTLSGGEKVRAQLARMLMDDPDVLLLDEPTNDLDIPTLEWLERFLNTARQPVLFISHDETLIENTANVIIHIEQLLHKRETKITVTRAPYREYLRRRGRLFEHQNQVAFKQRADYDRQMQRWRQIHDRVEHEQQTISRGDPHGGRLLKKKMRSVQATGRRLERAAEDFTDFAHQEEAILTRFDEDIRLPAGKSVLDFSLGRLAVGDRELARNIRLSVTGGEPVGIIGPTGAGKSTLLELLWEELRARRDITAAWMPQDYARALPFDKTPIGFLTRSGSREESVLIHNRLASMRFTFEEMNGPIAALSGGQRAKLLFLDMVLRRADVLLLDEPTRNFSPLSAPVVREALRAFGGAIISVSHDRKYLAEVCTAVYELTPEGLVKR
ncbi:MAG: ABC-F family ATP-binding cassette domain-containing protein [Oscillospiraceae bacterium]|nr:ABC-F family ATP-binding cassette domain-containing protein [Oscillospiraceae bacterium]